MGNKEVKPIAIPGIHSRFYKFFKKTSGNNTTLRVLDIGAGHGALARKLFNNGFKVEACDLHPENFHFDGIDCEKADVLARLPYDEGSFDVALAIEVMEHIFDHEKFFSECHRILKEEGLPLISTPNILSLKSRFRFLFTGFFYSFKPLDIDTVGGFQHLSALTLDQYRDLGKKWIVS